MPLTRYPRPAKLCGGGNMNNRTTHGLLAALVLLMLFGVAMHQHQARQTRLLLKKLIGQLEQREPIVVAQADRRPVPAAPSPRDAPETTDPPAETDRQASDRPAIAVERPAPPKLEPVSQPQPEPAEPELPEFDQGPPAVHLAAPPRDDAPKPTAPQPAPTDSEQWERFGPQVTRIIRQLLDGEYDAVIERFNPEMASVLNRQRLAAAMDPLRRDHGPMRRVLQHARPPLELPRNLHAFVVTIETRTGEPLTFTITMNDQDQVAGLYMK